jgi:hypothetical protein
MTRAPLPVFVDISGDGLTSSPLTGSTARRAVAYDNNCYLLLHDAAPSNGGHLFARGAAAYNGGRHLFLHGGVQRL